MEKKPIWWQELSWPEVAQLMEKTDTVLLPIGSTEQHGRHLPLGVDVFIPMGIAQRVSAQTGVPILPPIWYVPCAWHQSFPGAIHVSAQTVIAQIVEICDSLSKYGVKHVIGINGHTGGCDSTLVVAADQVLEKTEARFWIASVVEVANDEILALCDSPVLGHADEIETSKMMALRPELVHLEGVEPNNQQPRSAFLSVNYRPCSAKLLYRMSKEDWRSVAPDGYIGDPLAATPEKGERMLCAAAENIVRFIHELEGWNGKIEPSTKIE
ncbi:MAG: creatininase family protein [Anaerotruncus sp.]|nr:creatininase family protein [Anaerotruncus sp.]